MKNVVLIGFMGTCKTTVRRLLSARRGRELYDVDNELAERHGMSICARFAAQ